MKHRQRNCANFALRYCGFEKRVSFRLFQSRIVQLKRGNYCRAAGTSYVTSQYVASQFGCWVPYVDCIASQMGLDGRVNHALHLYNRQHTSLMWTLRQWPHLASDTFHSPRFQIVVVETVLLIFLVASHVTGDLFGFGFYSICGIFCSQFVLRELSISSAECINLLSIWEDEGKCAWSVNLKKINRHSGLFIHCCRPTVRSENCRSLIWLTLWFN